MKLLAANLAATTLGSNLASSGTTLTLAAGTGSDFPSPTPGATYFLLSLFQAGSTTNQPNEIVQVTNRVGDTCTVVRAQEGTAALNWSVGDTAANQWTAGSMLTFAQQSDVQEQEGNFADDTGTANAGVVTLSPAPGSLTAGLVVRVKKVASVNSGAYTLNVNGLGAVAVQLPGGVALTGGELPASGTYTVLYDGSVFELQSLPGVLEPQSVTLDRLQNAPADTVLANPTGSAATAQWVGFAQFLTDLGIVIPTYAQFNDQQASGTPSGESLPASAWTTRNLNTTVLNTISGASLSGDTIILPAGTYNVQAGGYAQAAASVTNMGHKIRVFDVTDSAVLCDGLNAATASGADNVVVEAFLTGQFTISGTKTIALQSFIADHSATGGAMLSSGDPELYASIFLTKIA